MVNNLPELVVESSEHDLHWNDQQEQGHAGDKGRTNKTDHKRDDHTSLYGPDH